MVQNAVERLKAVPGVELASATCCVPLQGGYGLPFRVSGRPLDNGPFHGGAGWTTVSPGYFEIFRIPVRKGRSFATTDRAASTPVVVVNEAFARQFFQGQEAIGQRLTIGKGVMREFATEQEREIIGIVGDSRDGGIECGSAAADVHSAGPGAGRGQCVECVPVADCLGCPDPCRPRPSSAPPFRIHCARPRACPCRRCSR